MKARKILSLILAVAMIIGTMSTVAFAEATEEPGGPDFASNDGMTVFDGTTYYATLAAAVKGVHGTKGATLYCKPGADVGTLNHAHVCKDLTVYGNGAYISVVEGTEQDFELDTPAAGGNDCVGLTEDVTLTVDNLTGASAWGTKNTEHDINLVFTNCQDMDKVSFYNFAAVSDTLGDINISLTDCTFTDNEPIAKIFSHMPGTVELNNVDFSGISQPVSFSNKLNRELSVTLNECDFENCGSDDLDYTVPVSVKSTAANGTATLVVDSCTFTGTTTSAVNKGADILLDGGDGKTTATISGSNAILAVKTEDNVVTVTELSADDVVIAENTTTEVKTPAAEVNGTYYTTLNAALDDAEDGDTIKVLAGEHILSERIFIQKAVTFVGEEGAEIVATGTKNYIIAAAEDGVIFQNLKIVAGEDFVGEKWIYDSRSNNDAMYSVLCALGPVTATNCAFLNKGSASAAILLSHDKNKTYGTYLTADGSLILDNTFEGFTRGVRLCYDNLPVGSVEVTKNTFTKVDYPVDLYWGVNENDPADIIVNENEFVSPRTEGGAVQVVVNNFALGTKGDTAPFNLEMKNNIASYENTYVYTKNVSANSVVDITEDVDMTYSSFELAEAHAAPGSTFYLNYGSSMESKAEVSDEGIITFVEIPSVAGAAAFVNGKTYETIDEAIADANDGDTITIFPGTYNAFTIPESKNNLTFVGATDENGNNLVTIRTLEEDIETKTKGIYVQAEKATFKNLDIISGSALPKWCCGAIGATNNEVGLGSSKLADLTVENCNFKGYDAAYAIWARLCNITVSGCTFKDYDVAIESYNLGADHEISIINSEFSNIGNAVHTSDSQADSLITIKDSVFSETYMPVSGAGDLEIEGTLLNNADIGIYRNFNLEITDSALIGSTVIRAANSVGSISMSEIYVDNINEFAYNAKQLDAEFTSYYATFEDYEAKANLKDVPNIADALYVEFEDVTATDAEGEKVYNINLKAPTSQTINRLNSVDLSFVLTQDNGSNEYEIIASNDEVTINNVEGNRYEFHYAGKDDADTDTATSIKIGQVKFTGYGQFDFAVDASATTNVAHATTIGDNLVDTYIPNGDETTVAEGELVISDDAISDVVIEVPTRLLTVEIDFNNAVVKQVADYQDMTVIVSGGDLPNDIEIKLGNETYTDDVEIFGKSEASYTVDVATDNKYTVAVTGALSVNRTYTVTVKGAGYRTVRKNITMAEDKTVENKLSYWNNVKDDLGADYLAGDIVKDNTINVYDLSAVVSYFGTNPAVTAESTYAKYDLNRDGKIDSKDVAYVLVSWGK